MWGEGTELGMILEDDREVGWVPAFAGKTEWEKSIREGDEIPLGMSGGVKGGGGRRRGSPLGEERE